MKYRAKITNVPHLPKTLKDFADCKIVRDSTDTYIEVNTEEEAYHIEKLNELAGRLQGKGVSKAVLVATEAQAICKGWDAKVTTETIPDTERVVVSFDEDEIIPHTLVTYLYGLTKKHDMLCYVDYSREFKTIRWVLHT